MVHECTWPSGGVARAFGRGSSYDDTETNVLFESRATRPVS